MASHPASAEVTGPAGVGAGWVPLPDWRATTRDRIGIGLYVLPLAIGAFELYGSFSVRAQPHSRALYAVVVLVVAALTAIAWPGTALPRRARNITMGFLLITPLYLFVTLFQPHWLPVYVVGDFVAMALPLIFLYAVLALPRLLSSPVALGMLATVLFVSALNAHLFGSTAGRSDPPSVLLIAMSWIIALRRSGPWWARPMGVCAVVIVGYLAFTSGYRTHVLLWVLAAPLVCFVLRGLRSTLAATVVAATGILCVYLTGYAAGFASELESSRFRPVLSGYVDASLENRIDEARDVLTTVSEEWFPGQFVIGSGFGSSYSPRRVLIDSNVNEHGTVHHVHIGPVMVYFRYGLLGLIVLSALVSVVMSSLGNTRRMVRADPKLIGPAIFSAAAALYLVNFLLRNSTVEPPMALSVGAVLYLWCTHVTTRVSTTTRLARGVRHAEGPTQLPLSGRTQIRNHEHHARPCLAP